MYLGYFVSYSAPSRDKRLYWGLLIAVTLWLLTLGYIWKERILLFLFFPGKEDFGTEILRQGAVGIQNGDGLFRTVMAVFQRCRNG